MAGKPRNQRPETLAGQIGQRIESLRKDRGQTSLELAGAAGVGLGTVIRLESGRGSPTVGTLAAVAAALGVELQELLPRRAAFC